MPAEGMLLGQKVRDETCLRIELGHLWGKGEGWVRAP